VAVYICILWALKTKIKQELHPMNYYGVSFISIDLGTQISIPSDHYALLLGSWASRSIYPSSFFAFLQTLHTGDKDISIHFLIPNPLSLGLLLRISKEDSRCLELVGDLF
jgi:hypothetical protein